MKEALSSSETSVLTRATRRNNQEDTILHSDRREDLKSYIYGNLFIYGNELETSPLLLRPFIGPLYQAWMIGGDNFGTINGMIE
jgi:hypothetical protein